MAQIGRVTVETMTREFGSDPADLIAAIGPSICKECYEVGEEVAGQFRELWRTGRFYGMPIGEILTEQGGGKYRLDLWKANEAVLRAAGVLPQHIAVTDICTCHNPEYLFSHRASGGKRGNFGAFIMLKE